jgi:hypothetical protein
MVQRGPFTQSQIGLRFRGFMGLRWVRDYPMSFQFQMIFGARPAGIQYTTPIEMFFGRMDI